APAVKSGRRGRTVSPYRRARRPLRWGKYAENIRYLYRWPPQSEKPCGGRGSGRQIDAVKAQAVFERLARERLRLHAAQARQAARDVRDVARIVAPPAHGFGREVGAVGLDQQ